MNTLFKIILYPLALAGRVAGAWTALSQRGASGAVLSISAPASPLLGLGGTLCAEPLTRATMFIFAGALALTALISVVIFTGVLVKSLAGVLRLALHLIPVHIDWEE